MKNPNEIKSQDDVIVNQGGRSSDVLVTTIEKCEKLELKLNIAVEALKKYADVYRWADADVKLGIDGFGIKSRKINIPKSCFCDYGYEEAQQALKKIEESDEKSI